MRNLSISAQRHVGRRACCVAATTPTAVASSGRRLQSGCGIGLLETAVLLWAYYIAKHVVNMPRQLAAVTLLSSEELSPLFFLIAVKDLAFAQQGVEQQQRERGHDSKSSRRTTVIFSQLIIPQPSLSNTNTHTSTHTYIHIFPGPLLPRSRDLLYICLRGDRGIPHSPKKKTDRMGFYGLLRTSPHPRNIIHHNTPATTTRTRTCKLSEGACLPSLPASR